VSQFLVLVLDLGGPRLLTCSFVLYDVLSCTVYVGAGVQFPQSVSVLVPCPICCVMVLDLKSGGIALTLPGAAIHLTHEKNINQVSEHRFPISFQIFLLFRV